MMNDLQLHKYKKRMTDPARQVHGEGSLEVASAQRVAEDTMRVISSPPSAPRPRDTLDALDEAAHIYMAIRSPNFHEYLYPKDRKLGDRWALRICLGR